MRVRLWAPWPVREPCFGSTGSRDVVKAGHKPTHQFNQADRGCCRTRFRPRRGGYANSQPSRNSASQAIYPPDTRPMGFLARCPDFCNSHDRLSKRKGSGLMQGDFRIMLVNGNFDSPLVADAAFAERARTPHEHTAAVAQLAIEGFDEAGAGFADDVGSGRQYLPVGPPLVGKVARVPVVATSVRPAATRAKSCQRRCAKRRSTRRLMPC